MTVINSKLQRVREDALTLSKSEDLLRGLKSRYIPQVQIMHQWRDASISFCVHLWPLDRAYVFIRPWARGWSVHVSDKPYDLDRDSVPERFKGLCKPVHNRRNVIGPWETDTDKVLEEVDRQVDLLLKLSAARKLRYMKQNWHKELMKHMYKLWGRPNAG